MEVEPILGEPVHVMPQFGPSHTCSPTCWCHPAIDNMAEVIRGEHTAYLFLHNVAH